MVETVSGWESVLAPELTAERCLSLATAVATFSDQQINQERPLLALNTALVGDGVFILAPTDTALPAPVRIGDRRYQLELPLDPAPERLLAQLTAAGAHLVSLNPIRDTLEDFFVEQVTTADVMSIKRGLEDDRQGEAVGTGRMGGTGRIGGAG